MYLWVLDNLDCKNSRFFFSKSVKKSVKRGVRVLRARSARASHALRAREKLPSLALCFQPCSRPFVWLLARTWIRKNTDCFAVYGQPSISEPGNWNNLLTAMDIKSSWKRHERKDSPAFYLGDKKGYDIVSALMSFLHWLMRFLRKKRGPTSVPYVVHMIFHYLATKKNNCF